MDWLYNHFSDSCYLHIFIVSIFALFILRTPVNSILKHMRIIIILTSFFLLLQSAPAQQTRYQTNKAALKISAFKNGENYQWENKEILVFLDYRTGNFVTRLKNTDFRSTVHPEFHVLPPAEEETEYLFKGILPINDIINQKSINQTYPIELQIVNEALGLDETLSMQMTITRPGSGAANYRVFSLAGKMYNDQLQLPAFLGFDNEIEIWIVFNAFSNN